MTSQPALSPEAPPSPTELDDGGGENPKKRPNPSSSGDGDDETEKLAARREANRVHAFKSRQRSKALLQELQRAVELLSGDKSELERENAVLRAQVDVLQQQNLALTQSQRMLLIRAGQPSFTTGAAALAGSAAALGTLGAFGLPTQAYPPGTFAHATAAAPPIAPSTVAAAAPQQQAPQPAPPQQQSAAQAEAPSVAPGDSGDAFGGQSARIQISQLQPPQQPQNEHVGVNEQNQSSADPPPAPAAEALQLQNGLFLQQSQETHATVEQGRSPTTMGMSPTAGGLATSTVSSDS